MERCVIIQDLQLAIGRGSMGNLQKFQVVMGFQFGFWYELQKVFFRVD